MGFSSPIRPQQGNRSVNRLRLGVAATLGLPSGTQPCLIDDISRSGAHLRIQRPLDRGTGAELSFHELRVFGVVVWSLAGECGLRFDRPLDLEDMQGMLWITENRELYERICREGHAQDWADGIVS